MVKFEFCSHLRRCLSVGALLRSWWHAWCRHVGGFSEAKDMTAWKSLLKKKTNGRLG
jgi:hypothetical protein